MGRDQSPIEVVETAFVLASTDRYKVSAPVLRCCWFWVGVGGTERVGKGVRRRLSQRRKCALAFLRTRPRRLGLLWRTCGQY